MSLLLLLIFLPLLTDSDKSDCVAGQHWVALTQLCETCPSRSLPCTDKGECGRRQWKYSTDGVSKCTKCPKVERRCLCDTTAPSIYWGLQRLSDVVGCDNCTAKCYKDARHSLVSMPNGRISELVDWIECPCTNVTSCHVKNNITDTCFLNDCDKPYDEWVAGIVDDCFDEGVTQCNESCYEALLPFLPKLQQCNCYGTDNLDTCVKYKAFYKSCVLPTWSRKLVLRVISITLSVTILVVLCFLVVKFIVSTDQKLKRSGNLVEIVPYVDWMSVEHIGTAKEMIIKHDNQFVLANREILLKVPFTVLNKFGYPISRFINSEFIVLKIFSNCRSVAQTKEVSVLNAISDSNIARNNNIIKLYSVDNDGITGLSEFLSDLVSKSQNFSFLKDVIMKYYGKQSKYMIMNYCNGLSLDNYIKTKHSRTLPTKLILALCDDLATALHFLHQNTPSIIHCDIKPHNIFVKLSRFKRPSFILGDFGCAETFRKGTIWRLRGGTPPYLPPEWMICQYKPPEGSLSAEQIQAVKVKQEYPHTVDIYQYGLIVWLVMHGRSDPWSTDPGYVKASEEASKSGSQEVIQRYLYNMFLANFDRRPSFGQVTTPSDHLSLSRDNFSLSRGHVTVSRGLYEAFQDISELCWNVKVSQRISASEILARLQKMKEISPDSSDKIVCKFNDDKLNI